MHHGKKKSFSFFLQALGVGITLIILFFPGLEFDYSTGIDPSLSWAYNNFYHDGIDIAQQIIFPHGPLAFMMYPLYNNIIQGTIFRILLQLSIILAVFIQIKSFNRNDWVTPVVISCVILITVDFNLLLVVNVGAYYLLSLFNKDYYKHFGFLIAVLSIYVKAYAGILAGALTFLFIIIYYFQNKSFKKILLSILEILLLIIFLWLYLFSSFSGIFKYFLGLLSLALDNSSAVSLYPENNWILLAGFLVIVLIIPFLEKNKNALIINLLFSLCLFVAWKHGISREDYNHAMIFLKFIILYFILFICFTYSADWKIFLLALIALFFYYSNLKNTIGYFPYKKEYSGIKNFIDLVSNYNKIKSVAERVSMENINVNRLPELIIKNIANKTVDIYPWDFSIIPANNLKWKPRVVIQSYASYTSWLDSQNAIHFNSLNAPDFIIWHFNTSDEGRNPMSFESIDHRYILNDEPETILSLISNYERTFKSDTFLLLKKRETPISFHKKTGKLIKSSWNQWITVPDNSEEILRIKLYIKGNMLRKIKSFFYKDEEFSVYMKTNSGKIYYFKIIPKNAEDGIWINPLIMFSSDFIKPEKISEIKFDCSSRKVMKKEIGIKWDTIIFGDRLSETGKPTNQTLKFFGEFDSLEFISGIKFENKFDTLLQKGSNDRFALIEKDFYSEPKSYILRAGSFSEGFTVNLGELMHDEFEILLQAQCKAELKSKAALVLSIEGENKFNYWGSSSLNNMDFKENEWNLVSIYKRYKINTNDENLLKAYFWNPGTSDILIDDMKLEITEIKHH